jgi:hypothetical protein
MAKSLKDVIKKNPEPAKGTNVDPGQLGQYSAKYQVSESALDQYLSAKGIDPKSIPIDTKISHAKSAAFLKWKRDHQVESVMLDKSPVQQKQQKLDRSKKSHKEVYTEQLVDERCWTGYKPVPGKKPYEKGSCAKEEKGSQTTQITPEEVQLEAKKLSSFEKLRRNLKKGGFDMDASTKRIDDIMKKSKDSYDAWEKERSQRVKESYVKLVPRISEDIFADNKAATQTVMAPGEVSEKKRQMTKSARMIKALYKKHNMKEDMHDHEKEDKSVQTYGKKPKFDKADKEDSQGEKKPQAAAVLSGGNALTGTPRDTIEIDPMMRNRPGQPDVTKKDDKKKDEKGGKKEEKK